MTERRGDIEAELHAAVELLGEVSAVDAMVSERVADALAEVLALMALAVDRIDELLLELARDRLEDERRG